MESISQAVILEELGAENYPGDKSEDSRVESEFRLAQLRQLASLGVRRTLILGRAGAPPIPKWARELQFEIAVIDTATDPVGDLIAAADLLDPTFLLLNSSSYFQFDLHSLVLAHRLSKATASIQLPLQASRSAGQPQYNPTIDTSQLNFASKVGYWLISRDEAISGLKQLRKHQTLTDWLLGLERLNLDPPIEPSSAALESTLAALSSSHMPPACTRRLPCHPRTSTPSQNSPIGGSRLNVLETRLPWWTAATDAGNRELKRFLRPKPIIILDRDGVVNERPAVGSYVTDWNDFRWRHSCSERLAVLSRSGINFVVASNQSGIGRGLMAADAGARINRLMWNGLRQQGVDLLDVRICPHVDADVCRCRKPAPGMLLELAGRWQMPLVDTWFVGDDIRDIRTAIRAGCNAAYIGEEDTSAERKELATRGLSLLTTGPTMSETELWEAVGNDVLARQTRR